MHSLIGRTRRFRKAPRVKDITARGQVGGSDQCMGDRPTTEWCRDSFTVLKHPLPGRVRGSKTIVKKLPEVIFYHIDA